MNTKSLFYLTIILTVATTACKKSDFQESYADPSKISTTSVGKQFAGFLVSNREYVMPDYWNYFVVLRTTLPRYTQSVGWVNSPNQYVPGAAGITSRWENYYNFVAQYREFENIFNMLPAADQTDMRIYKIAAAIYFYDHTQKVVDLHGDIPWSEAGMLSARGGDYGSVLPKYDEAATIYSKILDDLKGFADEMNTLTVKPAIQTGFKNQDFVNKGNLVLWKKYNNSLRLKMLTRVSDAPAFQSRYAAEVMSIQGDTTKYPIISSNAENVQINVYNLGTDIHAKGFRSGLEDWDGNLASKPMIDHMKANTDPRLRVMFQPGINAAGVYNGLDPMLTSAAQTTLVAGGTLSIYNRSTLSRNEYFPGVLINTAEIRFMLSEFYLKSGNMAAAKTAYNEGIRQSIQFYYLLRTLSNDNSSGTVIPATTAEIDAYLLSPGVNWDLAVANSDKLKLLASQNGFIIVLFNPLKAGRKSEDLTRPFSVSKWIMPIHKNNRHTDGCMPAVNKPIMPLIMA